MESLTMYYGESEILPINTAIREGYTAEGGWATSPDGAKVYSGGQAVSNLTTTEDDTIILYAVWNVNSYTMNFYKDNACSTDLVGSITKNYGEELGTLPTFEDDGYEFVEWNTLSNGTGETITEGTLMGALDSTNNKACAVKTPKTITLTFDNNYTLPNNGYTGIKVRKYVLDFETINVKISVNIKSSPV